MQEKTNSRKDKKTSFSKDNMYKWGGDERDVPGNELKIIELRLRNLVAGEGEVMWNIIASRNRIRFPFFEITKLVQWKEENFE